MVKKLTAGLLVALAVFALAEGILWIGGVDPPIAHDDPTQGFSGGFHLFRQEGDWFKTRVVEKSRTFSPQSFRAEKPENGIRIFCLGGSSAYGFPRDASESFSGVLQDFLSAAYPERTIEVINVAGVSYAMHRVNIVFDEIAQDDPDIVIVYSGHNEYVETSFFEKARTEPALSRRARRLFSHLRLYGLLEKGIEGVRGAKPSRRPDVDRELDQLFTADQKREITDRYEEGLRNLVRKAQAKEIRPVLCTVPCNLRNWPPFKAHRYTPLSEADARAWNRLIRDAYQTLQRGDAEGAIRESEASLLYAPFHASTHFMLGKAHEALGDFERAKESYGLACDYDAYPQRRLSAIDGAIRTVAREEGATLVDVERYFEAQSEGGLIGFNLIEDYVHPTVEGHQKIAKLLWSELKTGGLIPETEVNVESVFEQIVSARGSGSPTDNAIWLYNQGVVMQSQGLNDKAIDRYRQTLALEPRYPAAAINLAILLNQLGERQEAVNLLEGVLNYNPEHGPARATLEKISTASTSGGVPAPRGNKGE